MTVEGTPSDGARLDGGVTRRRQLITGGAVAAVAGAAAVLGSAAPAGAQTTVPAYLPYGPDRLYDSRKGGGRLFTGEVDELTGGSALDFAWCLNVTVTGTVGSGWLAVYEAGTAYSGTSSINWFTSGQATANNAYVAIRASDSGINVRCGGGGSTDYVLDLVGILTPFTTSAAAAMGLAGEAARSSAIQAAPDRRLIATRIR